MVWSAFTMKMLSRFTAQVSKTREAHVSNDGFSHQVFASPRLSMRSMARGTGMCR